MKVKKILFLLHIPPPIHGSSVIGQYIKDSDLLKQHFDCDHLNLLASKKVSGTSKVSLNKIIGFIIIWFRLLLKLLKNKPDLCYIAITSRGAAFFRDFLLIFLLKCFGVKRVYHMHNKGVSQCQHNYIYDRCYRFVFKDADVILLSKLLYADVKKYVSEKTLYICPNGIKRIPSLAQELTEKPLNKVPKILFLSNLIKSKGVFVLLGACKLLKDRGISFIVVL